MTAWHRAFARGSLARAGLSSLGATFSDYVVFATLLQMSGMAAVATLLGCVVGGLINFTVNRYWVFDGRSPIVASALRYSTVSGASALANALLVGIATVGLGASARPAWFVVRVLVFLAVTFPLFSRWVFVTRRSGIERLALGAVSTTR